LVCGGLVERKYWLEDLFRDLLVVCQLLLKEKDPAGQG
jgi:hypothetical protein